MQTFLPYESFYESVQCLDNKRLGKQRVEAFQILKALYIEDYGWKNHPCVKMWDTYTQALQMYMDICIEEWIKRGFKNTMLRAKPECYVDTRMPHWLGNKKLHDSHKSNLLRKDLDFYKQYNWNVSNDMEYYWCGFSKKEKESK
jgi:hypothetical protein